MPNTQGLSLAVSHQPDNMAPKSQKDAPAYLSNLPRFHPAVYQSPNSTPNQLPSSGSSHNQMQSYRVSSGSSRDALRQYRELITASISMPRNAPSESFEMPAPRLDPLCSPGPVTPLALEEADNYLAAGSGEQDHPRHAETTTSDRERDGLSFSRQSR